MHELMHREISSYGLLAILVWFFFLPAFSYVLSSIPSHWPELAQTYAGGVVIALYTGLLIAAVLFTGVPQ